MVGDSRGSMTSFVAREANHKIGDELEETVIANAKLGEKLR